jgi:Type ISP C-terminal specificity domain
LLSAVSHTSGGHVNPAASDLSVTAGWGYVGRGGITMPGSGKALARSYTPEELAALEGAAGGLHFTVHQIIEHLGNTTYDVYLNDVAYWRNIPEKVWHYTLGGYPVIKKWLSYREHELIGRSLLPSEAREVSNIARRIAALLLLEPALDANYRTVQQSTAAWPAQKPHDQEISH